MTIKRAKELFNAMAGDWENHGDVTLDDIIDLEPAETFDEFCTINCIDE